MKSEKAKIGEGIYTAADAARILNIPYRKAQYWFLYYAKKQLFNKVGYQYHFQISDVVAVNFLTLIEMRVFYLLKEKAIKTSAIVNAHTHMSQILNTPYPFAKEDIYISNTDKKILFESDGTLITADKKLQAKIAEFIRAECEKIEFAEDRLASKYYPLGKGKSVVVDPQHQFGQPTIEGTNILTATIYDLYKGGDSVKLIASLYDITPQNVQDVIEFSQAA